MSRSGAVTYQQRRMAMMPLTAAEFSRKPWNPAVPLGKKAQQTLLPLQSGLRAGTGQLESKTEPQVAGHFDETVPHTKQGFVEGAEPGRQDFVGRMRPR